MRRNTLFLLVGAVAALAVACRDSVVAPARNANSLSASASPEFSASGSKQNRELLGRLELSPNGGTYRVGDFDIVMPAGAVCDPGSTKYGARHWDDDCVAAKRSITVDVVAKKHGRSVSVDFEPDLRFRPSAGWVVIQTRAYSDLLTSSVIRQLSVSSPFFQNFAILYVPKGGNSRVDERQSTGDASMVTHVDLQSGLVWRRIKHFSGYLVTAGYKCDPTAPIDNQCVVDDPLGDVGSGTPLGAASMSISQFFNDLGISVVVTPNDSTTSQP